MGPEEARRRRLAAIFAADVAGYSRLMGQHEAATVRALAAVRATLGRLIAEYGGRIVNSVGDSVLAEFPSTIDAVKCSMAVQARLAELDADATAGPRLALRIAVHVGDALPSGVDIYGDGINVCARLQEIAEPGGICVSGAAYHYIRKALPVAMEDLGERTLKNIDDPVRVFAIRAAQGPGYFSSQPKSSAASAPLVKEMDRILIGTIVGGITLYAVSYLIFDVAVADFYRANRGPATDAFRDVPINWAVVLAQFPLALLLTLVIVSRAASETIGGGFITGGIIGFLMWFHVDFVYYGYFNIWNMPIPIVDPLLEMIHQGVGGALIAAVLARIPRSDGALPAR